MGIDWYWYMHKHMDWKDRWNRFIDAGDSKNIGVFVGSQSILLTTICFQLSSPLSMAI